MKDICLVVPTNCESNIKQFIERWEVIGIFDEVDLIIIEDNPVKTFSNARINYHYSWEDIELQLNGYSWIIPRRSSAIRSFGYWAAWKLKYKYILTLDDICYPPLEEDGVVYPTAAAFIGQHLKYICKRTKWFNTLNSAKPRGIPFYNLGENTSGVLNHGLWTNVLDYDTPFQLANPTNEEFSFDNRVVPNGVYFPMSGMNMMWKAKVTVLMYHLLMGYKLEKDPASPGGSVPTLEKLPFDNFGDIFCGVILKKICDIIGYTVTTGMPYARRECVNNPLTNLKNEANAIEVNERFWKYIDEFTPSFNKGATDSLMGLYCDMGIHIGAYKEFPEYTEYFDKLGQAMIIWSKLFKE